MSIPIKYNLRTLNLMSIRVKLGWSFGCCRLDFEICIMSNNTPRSTSRPHRMDMTLKCGAEGPKSSFFWRCDLTPGPWPWQLNGLEAPKLTLRVSNLRTSHPVLCLVTDLTSFIRRMNSSGWLRNEMIASPDLSDTGHMIIQNPWKETTCNYNVSIHDPFSVYGQAMH